ncbi:MAG: 4-alpha-glucanotransferase [Hyphomicrobiales bacterium]|nr:4-alpha-glucanotransferase [Hyphomicrobiales bacterium]
MSEATLRELAAEAGVAPDWKDLAGVAHRVSAQTLRALLSMLGFPCDSESELRDSRARLQEQSGEAVKPCLITTRLNEPLVIPAFAGPAKTVKLCFEDGSRQEFVPDEDPQGRGLLMPRLDRAGYHRLETGDRELTLAVAPPRCFTVADVAQGERIYGLAAQVYGLRRAGDGGTGDMGGVRALGISAAHRGADALALSPLHALFSAIPERFGPYSPSSRLFYNPLHADPTMLFGAERIRACITQSGLQGEMAALEALDLVDWPRAARAKLAIFRSLFESFERSELAERAAPALAADFRNFAKDGGKLLAAHARFEALHASRLAENRDAWNWRDWPNAWRDPESAEVRRFVEANTREIEFHTFLQWLMDRSLASTQKACTSAGMRIGLISDLAIGMDGAGSHAWSRQRDILVGASIGAPPDYYNANGQNWGLTAFSPHALAADGFAPYLATLRAVLRHAGGVRIDHAMGLMRLWLIPEGASPTQGAYVSYPVEDLFRLTALESLRHRAIIIGEDLGTLPHGFRERLAGEGIAGMQVLRFERDEHGFFRSPQTWRESADAMTVTHDLPPTAGWWSGHDIEIRAALTGAPAGADLNAPETERRQRATHRHFLWGAFCHAGSAKGEEPPPETPQPAVDAAANFTAATPCGLALLPLEDALGEIEQPNLPGTVDEHPNWRRRHAREADALLDAPLVEARLEMMRRRRTAKNAGGQ